MLGACGHDLPHLRVGALRDHRHGRMVGIERLHQPRRLFDGGPDERIVGQLALDLVADAPGEQRVVVPVARDDGAEGRELRLDRGAVAVVEAAARRLEPEPGDDLHAEPSGRGQHRSGIAAIGADGRGAERLQRGEPAVGGGAADREGPAVDQDVVTPHRHRARARRRRRRRAKTSRTQRRGCGVSRFPSCAEIWRRYGEGARRRAPSAPKCRKRGGQHPKVLPWLNAT